MYDAITTASTDAAGTTTRANMLIFLTFKLRFVITYEPIRTQGSDAGIEQTANTLAFAVKELNAPPADTG